MKLSRIFFAVVLAGLAACDGPQTTGAISPIEPGPDAIGHYCGMNVADHAGPKGQIFLEGRTTPIWFSSVRDTLAFTLLPEEPKNIAAIYVNDMGKSTSWDRPEPGTWVAGDAAVFVTGSDARGGMGAAEIVPFSDRDAAERFRASHGGEIFAFGEVPERHVLGTADEPASSAPATDHPSSHTGH